MFYLYCFSSILWANGYHMVPYSLHNRKNDKCSTMINLVKNYDNFLIIFVVMYHGEVEFLT